ncbi:twin-arginine translocation signal domain-containing protein [Providencia rettgeri]
MSKALSEGVLQSEISRRKLMQTSTVGGLALASGALSDAPRDNATVSAR